MPTPLEKRKARSQAGRHERSMHPSAAARRATPSRSPWLVLAAAAGAVIVVAAIIGFFVIGGNPSARSATPPNATQAAASTAVAAQTAIAEASQWPAAWAASAPAPTSGGTVDGIPCISRELFGEHIHQHLVFVVDGQVQEPPQYIGINPQQQCIYWLHSHTPDGLIHIEAPAGKTFVLGNYMDMWHASTWVDRSLLEQVVALGAPSLVYLNGQPYHGDPWQIALHNHTRITIEYGQPVATPAPYTFPF